MKKVLCALCLLLLCSPAFAVDSIAQGNVYFHYDRGSFEVSFREGLPDQANSLSGSFSPAVLSVPEGFSSCVASVTFEGAVPSGKGVYGAYEFLVYGSDLSSGFDPQDLLSVFNCVRPIIYSGVGFDVYDYLSLNNRTDLISVSGSAQTGFSIVVPVVIYDKAPAKVQLGDDFLRINDGTEDGIVSISSCIGIKKAVPSGNVPVLTSSGLSLKNADIDVSLLDREEAEADFEFTGQTDWPGKEGVLDAVSVGSFVGTYGGTGKASSLKAEVSVSAVDLKKLSADRYKKLVSAWSEDRTKFLDYYHIYKQIGNTVYDLVMMIGKDAFTVSGDPTAKVTVSFNLVLIDDVGNAYYDESAQAFVIYDGQKDGRLVDPLFVGTPEMVAEDTEDTEDEEDIKHVLPDNPAGASTGHDDLDKWFSIFSLF